MNEQEQSLLLATLMPAILELELNPEPPLPTGVCGMCRGQGKRLIAWPPGAPGRMVECSDCEGSGVINDG